MPEAKRIPLQLPPLPSFIEHFGTDIAEVKPWEKFYDELKASRSYILKPWLPEDRLAVEDLYVRTYDHIRGFVESIGAFNWYTRKSEAKIENNTEVFARFDKSRMQYRLRNGRYAIGIDESPNTNSYNFYLAEGNNFSDTDIPWALFGTFTEKSYWLSENEDYYLVSRFKLFNSKDKTGFKEGHVPMLNQMTLRNIFIDLLGDSYKAAVPLVTRGKSDEDPDEIPWR